MAPRIVIAYKVHASSLHPKLYQADFYIFVFILVYDNLRSISIIYSLQNEDNWTWYSLDLY
jgi:hypothetical protein